jgi:predicted HAD superfamily Cof-like phosphohydrolase
MPCYDHRDHPDYVRAEVEQEMKGRVDELADWLCLTLAALEELGVHPKNPKLKKWWKDHKAFDAQLKEKKND